LFESAPYSPKHFKGKHKNDCSQHNLKRVMAPLFMIAAISACSDSDNGAGLDGIESQVVDDAVMLENIVDTAVAAGGFETLYAALQATGLDATLADEAQQFTVFAPTDEAFAALGEDTINALLADTDTLSDILLYHVLAGDAVDAETATSLAGTTVATANGDSVALTLRDGALFINDSQVVTTDIEASNGIIHVIDAVLLPPADEAQDGTIVDVALASGSFTTLVAALQATGLDSVLADESSVFTVFAPTDEAFALLGEDTINALLADTDTLSDILLYHVVAGQAVDATTALSLAGSSVEMANGDLAAITLQGDALFIAGAQVVSTDIVTSNGIIHVIDAVILPPEEQLGTLVDVAVEAGFSTLAAALQATGLDAVLADESRSFTVFAPTNEAFAALGQEAIDELLADPETLSNILLYHVVADSAVDAETAISLAGSMVEMANGDSTTLSLVDGVLLINDSAVTATDVAASNGIIHVIDTVLLP
jgi:transforming growth factor-beta-induced protein